MINKKRNSSLTPSYILGNSKRTVRIVRITLILTAAAGFRAPTSTAPTSLALARSFKLPKKAASTKRHGPLPPKPSRLSPAEAKRAAYVLDCDADDERILSQQGSVDPSSSNAKVSSKPLAILPSRLDNDSRAACDETNPPPAASAQPSPSKARCNAGAAGTKFSLLGLTDGGGDLSDVPKMDSPELDETGLALELDTIVKGLDARLSSPASAHTSTSNEVNTMRSTRHFANRDVKMTYSVTTPPAYPHPEPHSNPKPNPKATSHAR
ncbi:hypothetical protein BU17DRAFT_97815 [Hysterangium stoloniferum]|nr:hypothetical protein BU17DRAFT_97815 [Hysterangium stoloniferum]